MRFLVVLPALVAVGLCAPQVLPPGQKLLISPTPPEPILRDARQGPDPSGNYAFEFETAGGIYQQEQGSLANPNEPDKSGEAVQGSFQYPGENGAIIRTEYKAGPNGFEAFGDHLPKSPAVPIEIQRALEWLLSQPPYVDPYDPEVIAAQRPQQYAVKK